MTRWFYTDPLAAAWMAKHFGMKFIASGEYVFYGSNCDDKAILSTYSDREGDYTEPSPSNWHIHPDSLHLLEPMLWDKLEYGDYDPKNILTVWPDEDFRPGTHNISRSYADEMHGGGIFLPIIQRNGIPFHWPLK